MSEPLGVLDTQVQTLLDLVQQHLEEHCRQARDEAQEKRRAILQQAHEEARGRMHEAVALERRRSKERLEATRAQLQTRARQHQHRTALLLLRRGWELLGQAALQRWKAAAQRRQWIRHLLQQALRLLPPRPWVIEHPPGWACDECEELPQLIHDHCGTAPEFRANDQLHAGLRICADGACLDGTLEGLLADREVIEAQLLAELNHMLRSEAAEVPAP